MMKAVAANFSLSQCLPGFLNFSDFRIICVVLLFVFVIIGVLGGCYDVS
jgi:hypothetical protein